MAIPCNNRMTTPSMEQHAFKLLLIIDGTTKKVLQFIMPLEPMYNKTFSVRIS